MFVVVRPSQRSAGSSRSESTSPSSNHDAEEEQKEDIAQDSSSMPSMCVGCISRRASEIVMPCGHLSYCKSCMGDKVESCSICRAPIESIWSIQDLAHTSPICTRCKIRPSDMVSIYCRHLSHCHECHENESGRTIPCAMCTQSSPTYLRVYLS